MRNWLILLLFTAALAAQPPAVSGPVLGYVFDDGLRPVLGTPGAAVLGDRIDLRRPLLAAVPAPSGGFALAVTADDQSVVLIRFAPALQVTPLGSSAGGRIVFSPNGSSAAVFEPGQSRISVWTGLPENPAGSDLDAGAPAVEVAVDDAGDGVLAAVQDGEGFRVISFSAGAVAPVRAFQERPVLVFLPGSGDALLAAPRSADLLHSGTADRVAGEEAGITSASAAGILPGTRVAVIANRDPGALLEVDLDSGTATTVSCPCSPSVFRPVSARIYQLTEVQPDAPVWFADFSAAGTSRDPLDPQPRIFFVPPAGAQR